MSGLFLIAVFGSIVFALAEDVVWLTIGRGLMGLGCAAGLMGSLVAISRWFEPARFEPAWFEPARYESAWFDPGSVRARLGLSRLGSSQARMEPRLGSSLLG